MRPVDHEIKEAVLTQIADFTGMPVEKIKLDDDLFKDLGVDGDDASELIDSLVKKFAIDTSQFDISKHFGAEKPFCIFGFLTYFFSKRKTDLAPLTVGNLVHAAIEKRLK